jgi:hypothetical protein
MKNLGDIETIYNLCKVSPTYGNRYVLLDQYMMVPAGYKTNGANIPMIFWWVTPPFKPEYLPAVIVHDYLCDEELYSEADKYFESILYKIDKNWKTWLMVKFVKLYHRIKYGVK